MQQVILRIRIPQWLSYVNPFLGLVIVAVLALLVRGLLVWRRKQLDPTAHGSGRDTAIIIVSVLLFAGWRVTLYLRDSLPAGIPVYGFGLMLFVGFVICTWFSSALAERE